MSYCPLTFADNYGDGGSGNDDHVDDNDDRYVQCLRSYVDFLNVWNLFIFTLHASRLSYPRNMKWHYSRGREGYK
jgi:hypothetical protein